MQRDNGTPAACASCRHQRKKCPEDCVLAPYFPVERNNEFQAVHKLFGVSNVAKIVTSLNPEDRKRAVDSLVWEATCRQNDPILGSYGEYERASEELHKYRAHFMNNYHVPGNMNRNMSAAMLPANSPYLDYGYQTLQSTSLLRDEISYNFPYVQNTEGFKEARNNQTVLNLPQQYGVQNNENLKDKSNAAAMIRPLRYGLSGTNQPYDDQLPGEFGPGTEAKP